MDPFLIGMALAAVTAPLGLAAYWRHHRRHARSPQALASHFERQCARALHRGGWAVRPMGGSGDQGADLLAVKGRSKLVVQCKHTARPVGNKAVQEALAARTYYEGTHAAVVSASGFTKGAADLAQRSDVLLLRLPDLRTLKV